MITMKNTSMTSTGTEVATDGQWKQIKRVIEDSASKAVDIIRKKFPIDQNSAQVILMSGDQIQSSVVDTIIAKFRELTATNQFADEVVESKYIYPSEYSWKPLLEQIETLRKHFPELKVEKTLEFIEKVLPTLELPEGAENWFAIPRWQKIASTYNAAFERLVGIIASTRKFKNWREGQLGPKNLKQHARTIAYLEKLAQGQEGDILIVPAQFGMKHRGESSRRAREVFQINEFGLGAFGVGCMLITHPDRAVRWEELDMDCPGDEFSPDAVGRFSGAPVFGFVDGKLGFGACKVDYYYEYYGSVSAFLPQYPNLENSNN